MPIITQYIFGSHARGDFHSESDIDLLAVTDGDLFSSLSHGKLNVSFYPRTRLLEDAKAGNLFVMHIVLEAASIYDPTDFHSHLKEAFSQRADYSSEILRASDLGWFLVRQQSQFRNRSLVNRRLSWCVRTILIAHSVEQGAPLFSPHELTTFAGKPYAAELLALKSHDRLSEENLTHLQTFLEDFGRDTPPAIMHGDLRATWAHFRNSKNSIGIKTIAQMEIDVEDTFYSS